MQDRVQAEKGGKKKGTERGSVVTSQQYNDRNTCSLKSSWHILASSGPGGRGAPGASVG